MASVHCVWHFSLRGCSSLGSTSINRCNNRLPRPAVRFVLAGVPKRQSCRDTAAARAARSLSHVWPLIRAACVCTHGSLARLIVCMLACLCPGDFWEKARDRMSGRAVECVVWWFCPLSECPCIWFTIVQGVHRYLCLLLVRFYWGILVTLPAKWISSNQTEICKQQLTAFWLQRNMNQADKS